MHAPYTPLITDYKDHPNFKTFEDLDDDVKEDMKNLPLDLLKFINFSGYSVVRWVRQDLGGYHMYPPCAQFI